MTTDKFCYLYVGNTIYYCGQHCYAEILSIEKQSKAWIKYDNNGKPTIECTMLGLLFEDEKSWKDYERKLYE